MERLCSTFPRMTIMLNTWVLRLKVPPKVPLLLMQNIFRVRPNLHWNESHFHALVEWSERCRRHWVRRNDHVSSSRRAWFKEKTIGISKTQRKALPLFSQSLLFCEVLIAFVSGYSLGATTLWTNIRAFLGASRWSYLPQECCKEWCSRPWACPWMSVLHNIL